MIEVEFTISNATRTIFRFCLEPWGGEYAIPSGSSRRVVVQAPSTPRLGWEIENDLHCFVVYEPAGTDATVYDGQHVVTAE
jgi:hypothetical protein